MEHKLYKYDFFVCLVLGKYKVTPPPPLNFTMDSPRFPNSGPFKMINLCIVNKDSLSLQQHNAIIKQFEVLNYFLV